MKKIKQILINYFGVDESVRWVLVNKIFLMIRGPVSIVFIIQFLTPEQQGLWVTFLSLSALTIFAELGFTTIITQFVSHEYAKLAIENGVIVGDPHYRGRLFGLIQYALKLYIIVVPIAMVILGVVGYFFFMDQSSEVVTAWILFSVISGLNLFISLLQSIYQGFDKVSDVQKTIFAGMVLLQLSSWLFLILGLHLWALVLSNLFSVILVASLLYNLAPVFWRQVMAYKPIEKIGWFHEIASLQWRYAVSWSSGYLMFNLFIPVVYKFEGAVVAGQLGLTTNVIRSLMDSSMSWLTSRIPKFNILVAKGQRQDLRKLFRKSFIQGYFFYIAGGVCFVSLLAVLSGFDIIATRFLGVNLVVLILFSELAEVKIWYLAVYLRSHKKEPFYWLSVLSSALITGVIFTALPAFGIFGVLIGLFAIKWGVGLPTAVLLYYNFNKKLLMLDSDPKK